MKRRILTACMKTRHKATNIMVATTSLILLAMFTMGIAQEFFVNSNLDYLYPMYELIDNTVRNDHTLMFKMKQVFFPATNFRFWQVDGAEVIPIDVCVTFRENIVQLPAKQGINATKSTENLVTEFEQCWSFLWTNSLLLNLIPGDILLAMDPCSTTILYSDIVGSRRPRGLTMQLTFNLNESLPLIKQSLDDYEQAFALFLCLSRAEMSPQLERTGYQGYIARWYTYYNSDPYFSQLTSSKYDITQSLLGLWGTFLFLNLLIPILFITRGKQMFRWLTKATAASNQRLYRAIVFTIILFNIVFILSTLVLHFNSGYPTTTNCYISTAREHCKVPPTSTSYDYILAIVITKAIILPIALLTELAAAVYRVIKDLNSLSRIKRCIQIIVVWQLLVFVQITVGLISIPLLVLLFISPATVLLSSVAIFLIFLLFTFIVTMLPIPKQCNFMFLLQSCLSTAETLLIVAFIGSAFATYYIITRDGLNMSGVKGYVTSLIPTILISIFIWILKKGFLGKQLKEKQNKIKRRLVKSRQSVSTESVDETINLLSTASN